MREGETGNSRIDPTGVGQIKPLLSRLVCYASFSWWWGGGGEGRGEVARERDGRGREPGESLRAPSALAHTPGGTSSPALPQHFRASVVPCFFFGLPTRVGTTRHYGTDVVRLKRPSATDAYRGSVECECAQCLTGTGGRLGEGPHFSSTNPDEGTQSTSKPPSKSDKLPGWLPWPMGREDFVAGARQRQAPDQRDFKVLRRGGRGTPGSRPLTLPRLPESG
ncbi:hypothetical protein DPEC_G00183530 [Dallia pectoralis]|uniref:Uncharacterized protein n=1 Tax=Dallia pectoralis TaxID=75939 RepID=A0ACC2GBB1_DALPE|nr:hypothetical protein DPEC_G00183530 [Dallia pectoralis]